MFSNKLFGSFFSTKQTQLNEALLEASKNDQVERIDALVRQGANLEAKDKNGYTPLHIAAGKGSIEAVIKLLEKGADLEAKVNDGLTPLHMAVWMGNTEVIVKLLEKGADLEAKNNNGLTPLHYAARYGSTEAVVKLLEKGADLEAKNNNGLTPLHYAVTQGITEAVVKLLERGADLEAKNNGGETPLHMAARQKGTEAVVKLLERGADLEAKDNNGSTPLFHAAGEGSTEAVIKLLERGADLEAKDKYGYTPLHIAALRGSTEIVAKLLERGADIEAKTNNGDTPLFYAEKERCTEIVTLLKSWSEKRKNVITRAEPVTVSSRMEEEKQPQASQPEIVAEKAIKEGLEKQSQSDVEALQLLHSLQLKLDHQKVAVSALEQQLARLGNNKQSTEEAKQQLEAALLQHKETMIALSKEQQTLKTEHQTHFSDLYVLHADLAEQMVPLQKDYLARIQDIKLKEQLDTDLVLIQAPGNEKLQLFYRYLSLKVTEMLIGDKAIGSGKVEGSKGTKEALLSKTIQIAGELITIPGAGIIAGLIDDISSEIINKYKQSKTESRSAAGGGMQEMLVLPNLLAAAFTLHLRDQIKKLTEAGGKRAAEMVMVRAAVALQMIDPAQPVTERVNEIVRLSGDLPEVCKRFGLKNQKIEIEAVPGTEAKPWTEGMFIRCGRQVVKQDAQGRESRQYYRRTLHDQNAYRSTRLDNKYGHAYVSEEEVRQHREWMKVTRYQQPSAASTPVVPSSARLNIATPPTPQANASGGVYVNSATAVLPAVQLVNKRVAEMETEVVKKMSQLEKENAELKQALKNIERRVEQMLPSLQPGRSLIRSRSFTELLSRSQSQSKVPSTSGSKI